MSMTKFLTSSNLDNEIESIIRNAKKKLILMSPYINLNSTIKELLLQKAMEPELEVIVAFREEDNGGNIKKQKQFESFENESVFKNLKELGIWKELPNVRLLGLKDLHAKYYANESKGIVTSLNLYRYSIMHNIEYGCLLRGDTFIEATNYSEKILEDWGNVVYAKVPRFRVEKGRKRYVDSVELCNTIYKEKSLVSVDKSKLTVREIVLKSVEDEEVSVENDKRKYSVEEKRRKYKNAYAPWDKESDAELMKLVAEGKSISELARVFKRTQDAIKCRIKKLSKENIKC